MQVSGLRVGSDYVPSNGYHLQLVPIYYVQLCYIMLYQFSDVYVPGSIG